jgi:hypothetical protein
MNLLVFALALSQSPMDLPKPVTELKLELREDALKLAEGGVRLPPKGRAIVAEGGVRLPPKSRAIVAEGGVRLPPKSVA